MKSSSRLERGTLPLGGEGRAKDLPGGPVGWKRGGGRYAEGEMEGGKSSGGKYRG